MKRNPVSFKCVPPDKTLARLEQGFSRLGLELAYNSFPFRGVYSSQVFLPNLNLFTNGKGLTEELARASAYAEMAERISARLFFPNLTMLPHYGILDDAARERFFLYGYMGAVHGAQEEMENPVKVESLLEPRGYQQGDIDHIKSSEISRHWVKAANLTSGGSAMVPIHLVRRISGSNGLASGNTQEEAALQAINEIFERHTMYMALSEKPVLPTIDPDSVKDPYIRGIISFLRENRITPVIKDFSFGMFPCIGVLFINENCRGEKNLLKRNLSYMEIRAASSFNAREALARCFTEYIQGKKPWDFPHSKNFDEIWNIWYSGRTYDKTRDLSHVFTHNVYDGDLSYLLQGAKTIFTPRDILDTDEELSLAKGIFRSLGRDIFVVDHTHRLIGFPAVRVVIPGMSDTLSFFPQNAKPEIISLFERNNHMLEYTLEDSWMEKPGKLIAEIEAKITKFPYDTVIFTSGLLHREINLFELLASLYVHAGNIQGAKQCIRMLRVNYPEEPVYEELLGIDSPEAMREAFRGMKGCFRFMASRPLRNPFTHWCDEACGNRCADRYREEINSLIRSF